MAQYVRMGKEKGLEGNGELEGEGRRMGGGDFNSGSQGRGRWVGPGAVELLSKMEPEGPLLVVAWPVHLRGAVSTGGSRWRMGSGGNECKNFLEVSGAKRKRESEVVRGTWGVNSSANKFIPPAHPPPPLTY